MEKRTGSQLTPMGDKNVSVFKISLSLSSISKRKCL